MADFCMHPTMMKAAKAQLILDLPPGTLRSRMKKLTSVNPFITDKPPRAFAGP